MGKVALLAVGAVVVMSAFYSMGSQNQMISTHERIAEHDYQTMAKNSALTGYNVAVQWLSGYNFASTVKYFDGQFEDAFYNVEVGVNGSTKIATVKAKGTMIDGNGNMVQYEINSKLKQLTALSTDPPPFMKYMILAEKDLTLNGNILLDTIKFVGSDATVYNANIHTNGKLTVKGNAAEIHGFGTYKTAVDVKHPSVFQPYDIATGKDSVLKRIKAGVKIPISSLHPDSLKARLPFDQTTIGTVTLGSTYDFSTVGTKQDPYVWYIDGDLKVTGNTKIKGYAAFIVNGNIDLGGGVEFGEAIVPTESKFAFYAIDPANTGVKGNISIKGNGNVYWGQIFARRDVVFQGTPKLLGNVIAGGTADVGGTPDLYYVPASTGLTQFWQKPNRKLEVLHYAESEVHPNS